MSCWPSRLKHLAQCPMNADGRMWIATNAIFSIVCNSSIELSIQQQARNYNPFSLPLPLWALYLCSLFITTISFVLFANWLVIGCKAGVRTELPTNLFLSKLALPVATVLIEKLGAGISALNGTQEHLYIHIFLKQEKILDLFFNYTEANLKKHLPQRRSIEKRPSYSSILKFSQTVNANSFDNVGGDDIYVAQPIVINSYGWSRPLYSFEVSTYSDQRSLPFNGQMWHLAMIGPTSLAHLNIFECDKFKPLLASIGWSGHGY